MADKNELPQNFGGDCILLQERLRRLAEMKGDKVDISIRCEMDENCILTLYGRPLIINGSYPIYGDIFYPNRCFCPHEYLNEKCAQALYEELNRAIKEMEEKED